MAKHIANKLKATDLSSLRTSRDRLVEELETAGATIKGNSATCIAHDDQHPSASLYQADDGVWRVKCHSAACGFNGDVIDVMAHRRGTDSATIIRELRARDQVPASSKPNGRDCKKSPPRKYATLQAAVNAARKNIEQNRGPVMRVVPFRYNDHFSVIRFELQAVAKSGKPDKEFRPVSYDGSAWMIADPLGVLPLFHADELADAEAIWLFEGEGKTDLARTLGLVATTSAHGSSSAHKSDWSPLVGTVVYIVPDNDDSGAKYAREVAAILFKQNRAARIKIIHLPGIPEQGDIADFIQLRRTAGATDAAIRSEIETLADATPWEATEPASRRRREAYKSFPVDVLPEVMARFIREGAEAVGVDPAMFVLPILSAAGACIGNSRRVEIKSSWAQPPLVNTAVIGYSGDGKSPSREHALAPIFAYQVKLNHEFRSAMATYQAEHAEWKTSGSRHLNLRV